MKAWTVLVGLGVVVVAGGLWIARDLTTRSADDARPVRQVTFEVPGEGSRTMAFRPDSADAQAAVAERLTDFEDRWHASDAVFRQTPRASLAGPIRDMQELAYEGRRIVLTDCLEPGRVFWSAALDAEVAFKMNFMTSGQPDGTLVKRGDQHYLNWKKVRDACR